LIEQSVFYEKILHFKFSEMEEEKKREENNGKGMLNL
jgi:hypothetical protein